MKNTYLITGGSGFLGINLVRYLLAHGHNVRVFDLAAFNYPENEQVEFIQGDIRDSGKFAQACRGVDILVHAAAALPLYSKEEIYSIDVGGTKTVLDAALQQKVARVIHISSTAVYGIPDHHPLTEDDALIGVGPYGEAKILAEKLCLDYRKQGLPITILRPKSFIGPERLGIFALFYDWVADGKHFPLPGKGDNRYQLLDVQDLCEAIYRVAHIELKNANRTYNIGARVFTTIKEDFQAVQDYAGFGKRIISLPAAPVVFALRILEKLRLAPLYRWVYETVFRDSYVSNDRAEQDLGFTPRYTNREALIRNYQWYIENRATLQKTSGITHREAWNQGVLKLLKYFF